MKTLLLTLLLFSSQADAWGPWGPGPWGYGMGMPYGYMYPPLQYPTFNYQQTVVVQQPQYQPPPPQEIIIREPPPRVIIQERQVEVCNQECERLRRYFNK